MAAMTAPRVRQGRVDDAILAASEILCRRYPLASVLFDVLYPDLARLVRSRLARVQIPNLELERIGRIAEGLDRLAESELRPRAEVVVIDQGQSVKAVRKTKRPRMKGQTRSVRPRPEARTQIQQAIITRVERSSPSTAAEVLDAEIVDE